MVLATDLNPTFIRRGQAVVVVSAAVSDARNFRVIDRPTKLEAPQGLAKH
jgi:hypothetical protein